MYAQYTIVLNILLGLTVKCIHINFDNALTSQNGLGWPHTIHIAKGNEALMKLNININNIQSCAATTPHGITFNVASPPGNEYQSWSDGCGLRVRDVKPEYEGRWRLTATRVNDSVTGWIELYVIDGVNNYQADPITLKDGEIQAKVELSTLENAYCVVAKPFSESSLVPGHCSLTLDRTTRSIQGDWDILLGIQGQVSEIITSRHVTVEAERLSTGYVHNTNTGQLHMYCNILHSSRDITFCRFQRTSSRYGYNVMDGLSDGSHSYYGDGFIFKQCGMTIEHPGADDFGTWRCSVGVAEFVNNQIVQQTPMQALINIPSSPRSLRQTQNNNNDEILRTVFVQEHAEYTITCQAEQSLSYCWFQHPNGSQFTPLRLSDQNQLFWYSGESLEIGDCGITFASANASDAGLWICHMGPRSNIGLEVTDQIELRVTGPLAANKKEIPVTIGGTATLYCHSSNGNRPLEYCRFLSANYMGLNIDSSVTEDNAIMERYYFTPERNLRHGDCSLNIKEVREEDLGEWTCAAIVDNEVEESRDTLTLIVGDIAAPSYRAGIVGMSVGLSVLLIVFVGYVIYKRGWIPPLTNRRNNTENNTDNYTDAFSLPTRSSDQGSVSSGSSIEEEIRRP